MGALAALALAAATSEGAAPVAADTALGNLAADVAITLQARNQQLASPTRSQLRAAATLAQRATQGPLPVEPMPSVCHFCHGVGYVRQAVPMGHPNFGKAVLCSCKEEEIREKRRMRFMRENNLTDEMAKMRFATFSQARQPIAYKVARAYVENDDTKPFFYMQGPPGTGKTHLAVAIAYALLEEGEAVMFRVVPDLMDWLRQSFNPKHAGSGDADFFAARFADICNAPWLVLDDCGAENPTPWAQEKFYQIVNHRYIHCLPTVFTTNGTLHAMDDRVRSRLSDRAICYAVKMSEEAGDYRSSEARGKEPTAKKKVQRAKKEKA